jgi:hypothetical protein
MDNPFAYEGAPGLAVSRSEALAYGLTGAKLRNVGVDHPHRDCYLLDGPASSLAERCAAARTVLPQSAVFSHATAATLWGWPLPGAMVPGESDPVQVTVPAEAVVPSIRGVRGHGQLLPEVHRAVVRGLPTTSPPRTLLDLAAVLGNDALVVLADAMLARAGCTLEDLAEVAAWGGRRRGVRRLREAIELASTCSRSPKESELRLLLLRAGLPAPEPNAAVFDEHGGWIAEADLFYREHRIVLEYDGRDHGREERRLADLRRRNLLMRAGYYVLTYSAPDLRRPWSIEADVRHAFAVHSARLGLSNPTLR